MNKLWKAELKLKKIAIFLSEAFFVVSAFFCRVSGFDSKSIKYDKENEIKILKGKISAREINLRDKPNLNSKVLKVLKLNEDIEIIDRTRATQRLYACSHYWFKAKLYDSEGWIYGEFIKDIIYPELNKKYTKYFLKATYTILIPKEWTISGTINDYLGEKIMEGMFLNQYSGTFVDNIIRKTNMQSSEAEKAGFPQQIVSNFSLEGSKYRIFKITKNGFYEGGCSPYSGFRFIIEYFIQLDDKNFVNIVFYSMNIDKYKFDLFDKIVLSFSEENE